MKQYLLQKRNVSKKEWKDIGIFSSYDVAFEKAKNGCKSNQIDIEGDSNYKYIGSSGKLNHEYRIITMVSVILSTK